MGYLVHTGGFVPRKLAPGFQAVSDGRVADTRVDEFDSLYNGILANPFDAAPRRIIADLIADFIGGETNVELDAIRRYPGNLLPNVPKPGVYQAWPGPGLVVKSAAFGTFDTWAGVSGQFMQACREGLFIDYPITQVIPCDIWPVRNRIVEEYCLFSPLDDPVSQTLWIQRDPGAVGYSVENLSQSLINDVIEAFLPSGVIYHYPGIRGAYRSFNRINILYAVSCAYVNLGRHAAGLPTLRWDGLYPPLRWRQWEASFESAWQRFRILYGVESEARNDDAFGIILDSSYRPKDTYEPSGRNRLRLMASGKLCLHPRNKCRPIGIMRRWTTIGKIAYNCECGAAITEAFVT